MSRLPSILLCVALASLTVLSASPGSASDLSVAFRDSSADLDTTSIPYLPKVARDQQQAPFALVTITDSRRTVTERVRAVESMGAEVDDSTVATLCKFVELHPADAEINLGGLRYLKNEILNLLRNQQSLPVHLADTLIIVAADNGQDLVTRDYAVQHMAALCKQIAGEGAQVPTNFIPFLFKLTTEKSTVAGTALIALHHLSTCLIGSDCAKVDAVALNLACDSHCSAAVRMTALQVCSLRHLSSVLPVAKDIALSSNGTSLRVSAIAVIGALGEPSDATIMRNIRADDALVKDAVANAMKELQRRSISMY